MARSKIWQTLNNGQSFDFVKNNLIAQLWKEHGVYFVRLFDKGIKRVVETVTVSTDSYTEALAMHCRAIRLVKSLA